MIINKIHTENEDQHLLNVNELQVTKNGDTAINATNTDNVVLIGKDVSSSYDSNTLLIGAGALPGRGAPSGTLISSNNLNVIASGVDANITNSVNSVVLSSEGDFANSKNTLAILANGSKYTPTGTSDNNNLLLLNGINFKTVYNNNSIINAQQGSYDGGTINTSILNIGDCDIKSSVRLSESFIRLENCVIDADNIITNLQATGKGYKVLVGNAATNLITQSTVNFYHNFTGDYGTNLNTSALPNRSFSTLHNLKTALPIRCKYTAKLSGTVGGSYVEFVGDFMSSFNGTAWVTTALSPFVKTFDGGSSSLLVNSLTNTVSSQTLVLQVNFNQNLQATNIDKFSLHLEGMVWEL